MNTIVLTRGSRVKAFGMATLGILLGMVGTDVNSGAARFTFGTPNLLDGLSFVVIATGMFGIGDVLANLETEQSRSTLLAKVKGLMPTREAWKRMIPDRKSVGEGKRGAERVNYG